MPSMKRLGKLRLSLKILVVLNSIIILFWELNLEYVFFYGQCRNINYDGSSHSSSINLLINDKFI